MSSGLTPELTDFERRVLEILVRGERVSDVAATLGLSVNEAQDCVRGVLAKLEPEPWASLSDRLNDALEEDHPHDSLLEGDGLLAHLRFRHVRGVPRYHVVDPNDLPRLHRQLHGGARESGA